MKTYEIEIIKVTKEFDVVKIKASCPQEAKELARKMAKEGKLSWDELQKPSYQTEIIA